jgi:cytidine deaminase
MTDISSLLAAATEACANAYAPYSRFRVGAAIRADDGRIYAGANVENAAYPEGQCAEASAIGAMVTGGGRRIREIVIVAAADTLCPPCGGCRQRIAEFADDDTLVHLCGPEGARKSIRFADLLPYSFGTETLARPG